MAERKAQLPVLVEWLDSKGVTAGWDFKDDLPPIKPVLCRTVGFLLESRPGFRVLAMTDSAEQVLGRMCIPAGCIKRIKRLR